MQASIGVVLDSTSTLVAAAWTGNGPFSQDVFSAVLRP